MRTTRWHLVAPSTLLAVLSLSHTAAAQVADAGPSALADGGPTVTSMDGSSGDAATDVPAAEDVAQPPSSAVNPEGPVITPPAPLPPQTQVPSETQVPSQTQVPSETQVPPRVPTPRQEEPGNEPTQSMQVIGHHQRVLERVPGSVTLIRREDLQNMAPQNGGDVLRTVPSLNVTSEDGMGLRLNIGIRGLDPNRSRKVLILEDGIPVTLNPYGSPELYYTPPIEHVERIEVVRGSGQILWGPQTIGGVINYITRQPPRRPTANVELRYGSFGYFLANASAGSMHGPVSWRLDVIHRRFDGPRRLDLSMTDISGRLRVQLSSQSVLGVRVNMYDEASRATYLGPSSAQFQHDPTINTAEHDRFLVRRYALAVTHQHSFSNDLQLSTNLYAYQTHRAWRRQEFDRRNMGLDYERICDPSGRCGPPGSTDLMPTDDGGSQYFRRTTAIRNRTFQNVGIEPRLNWRWSASPVLTGEFNAVLRFHHESAREQILIGTVPTAESGDPRDEEHRNGYALAAAVQNRFTLWNRVHITPGVRFENFWSNRRIVRAPMVGSDGITRGSDVNVFGQAFSWAIIPGIGVSVQVAPPLTLYGGVHRGYAPPRTRDAVSAGGVNLELDSELSWNSELGARLRVGRWLTADVAGFWMEFANQIIPPSEAGGTVSGGMFNSGHSRHIGAEASLTFDLAPLVQGRGQTFSLPLMVNYTFLPVADFVGGLFGGNRLPYAPGHQLYAQLRFVHQSGFASQVGLNYVASQFADRENTPYPSQDGLVGEIPGYLTLDARVAYTIRPAGLTLSLTGRNLTNQVYIANRAPQGIQPNGFLQVFFGVEWNWPRS